MLVSAILNLRRLYRLWIENSAPKIIQNFSNKFKVRFIIWLRYKAPESFVDFWNDVEFKMSPVLGASEIVMKFESLGENCEVAFLQSYFGAEPLSLFRWNGILMTNLIQALDRDLAGIGDLDETDFFIDPSDQEYHATDKRYGMNMHTRMFPHEASLEIVKNKFCRHIIYLRDKLLRDLRSSEKIFIFQSANPISIEEMKRLHQALCRHGPKTQLLCVQPAPRKTLIGRVEPVEDGLMAAYVDRAGLGHDGWNVSFDLWLRILYRTYDLFGRASQPPNPGQSLPRS